MNQKHNQNNNNRNEQKNNIQNIPFNNNPNGNPFNNTPNVNGFESNYQNKSTEHFQNQCPPRDSYVFTPNQYQFVYRQPQYNIPPNYYTPIYNANLIPQYYCQSGMNNEAPCFHGNQSPYPYANMSYIPQNSQLCTPNNQKKVKPTERQEFTLFDLLKSIIILTIVICCLTYLCI